MAYDTFTRIIPSSTSLYRSADKADDLPGTWFSLVASDSYGYGSKTGEFRTVKELRLLDITTIEFHTDLIQKINKLSEKNMHVNNNKSTLLFPLGFTDYEIYKEMVKSVLNIPIISPSNIQVDIDSSQFFNNRSRLSIKNLDTNLVLLLNDLYKDIADGIISPRPLPNRIQGGYHLKELFIFNYSYVEYKGEIARPITGGGIYPNQYYNYTNPFIENFVKDMDNYFKGKNDTKEVVSVKTNRKTRKNKRN